MEADFSGYATKAGLKCSDGRTIMPDAFKQQDKAKVPLVWQHGHTDPENVLGHVMLENRADGVYAYGFFNNTEKAKHARALLEHDDINQMSIWANQLIERSKAVLHGVIREVSLVLSGANPGALIENVTIRHADGDTAELDDEAIIYTGLSLQHSDNAGGDSSGGNDSGDKQEDEDELDVQEVVDSMTDEQQEVLHHLVSEALAHADKGGSGSGSDDETIADIYNSMSAKQKQVLHYMVGEAIASANAEHSNLNDGGNDDPNKDEKGNKEMKHNVFEDDKKDQRQRHVISHADMVGLLEEAKKGNSLREVVEGYALAHGIDDIDLLFPDAAAIDAVPEYLQRRTEWVAGFLGATRKSPFGRIKTLSADITEDQARAKGYIKGTLKKEEFFRIARRVTTPVTIYKKQKLDRDDMIDITDFDVVAWLKAEMRVMLDEEVARAALIGDGRDIADEDKINEQNIRPIASDHELFATHVYVNLNDASSSVTEFIDAVVKNRSKYKGTGLPTMFTTETVIAKFLLLRDTLGRKIYKSLDEVATELRVKDIVPVEVMEEDPDVLAIFVNPVDYVFGATRGGEVNLFDDFDIDYNQYKYLIETRCCGALVRLKSAIVVHQTGNTDVLVTPAAPTFDPATGQLVINDTAHVTYKHGTDTLTNAGGPYTVPSGQTWTITATPAAGYYVETSDDDDWNFTAD